MDLDPETSAWRILDWIERIPRWVKLAAFAAGGLMSAFSGRLPESLQDLGLWAGIALACLAAVGLGLHASKEWRGARRVAAWLRGVPPRSLMVGSIAVALMLVGTPFLYWVVQDRWAAHHVAVGTLNHALLTVIRVRTKQLHDPVKLEVAIGNVGRLPTIRSQIHVAFLIADSPTPATEVDKKFAELFADKDRLPMFDQTTVPGLGQVLIIWTYEVTEKIIEEMKAGKKNFFVFLVAEYTDAKTPSGRRIVTEVAFRSSPTASGPMRGWSHVRERTYLSD